MSTTDKGTGSFTPHRTPRTRALEIGVEQGNILPSPDVDPGSGTPRGAPESGQASVSTPGPGPATGAPVDTPKPYKLG